MFRMAFVTDERDFMFKAVREAFLGKMIGVGMSQNNAMKRAPGSAGAVEPFGEFIGLKTGVDEDVKLRRHQQHRVALRSRSQHTEFYAHGP